MEETTTISIMYCDTQGEKNVGLKKKVSVFCFHISEIYNHFFVIDDNLATNDNLRASNTYMIYHIEKIIPVTRLYVLMRDLPLSILII